MFACTRSLSAHICHSSHIPNDSVCVPYVCVFTDCCEWMCVCILVSLSVFPSGSQSINTDRRKSVPRAMTTRRVVFARPACSVWWPSTPWLEKSSNHTCSYSRAARYATHHCHVLICISKSSHTHTSPQTQPPYRFSGFLFRLWFRLVWSVVCGLDVQ